MSYTIQIVGLVRPGVTPHPFEGMYVVEYDPSKWTEAERNMLAPAPIEVTDDRAKAKRFATLGDARDYWAATIGRTRPDGQPDRPLTAFNVAISRDPVVAHPTHHFGPVDDCIRCLDCEVLPLSPQSETPCPAP